LIFSFTSAMILTTMSSLIEGYDLDRLAQALGYINIKASIIDQLLKNDDQTQAISSIYELKRVATDTYADVRETIFNLRTKVSGGADFLPALREYLTEYETQYGIKTRIKVRPKTAANFSNEIGMQLIRIIQEALSNVRKHAQAGQVTIEFAQDEDQSKVTIVDDGLGFDVNRLQQDRPLSFGLDIMQERAESVGGSLEIISTPGRGTRVIIHIPLANENFFADR